MAEILKFPQQEYSRPLSWRPITLAPRDRTLIDVLVPSRDGGFIQGRAYFDPSAYDGSWWWEGTSVADYFSDPISECNHGDPVAFLPLDRAS